MIIDGEMPLSALKDRLKIAMGEMTIDLPLHYLTADWIWHKFERGISLAYGNWQNRVDEFIEKIPGLKFILLDNIGSLVTGSMKTRKAT